MDVDSHQEYITLVVFPRPPFHYSVNMDSPSGSDLAFDGPAAYQITVQGKIAPGWSARLEGLTISRLTLEDGSSLSILAGELIDQAALTGVLNTLYELRLPLIAVNKLSLSGSRQAGDPPEG